MTARTLLELAESRHLQTFVQLIRIGGLDDLFNDFGNYTLFAPNENAIFCKQDKIMICPPLFIIWFFKLKAFSKNRVNNEP